MTVWRFIFGVVLAIGFWTLAGAARLMPNDGFMSPASLLLFGAFLCAAFAGQIWGGGE